MIFVSMLLVLVSDCSLTPNWAIIQSYNGERTSLHLDTLSRFWYNQCSLLLLSAVCLSEKTQIPSLQPFDLTRPGFELTIYRTRTEHGNHYTTDEVLLVLSLYNWVSCWLFEIYMVVNKTWKRLVVLFRSNRGPLW